MTEGIQLKTVKMKSGFKIERNCIAKDGYVDISESLQKIALGTIAMSCRVLSYQGWSSVRYKKQIGC